MHTINHYNVQCTAERMSIHNVYPNVAPLIPAQKHCTQTFFASRRAVQNLPEFEGKTKEITMKFSNCRYSLYLVFSLIHVIQMPQKPSQIIYYIFCRIKIYVIQHIFMRCFCFYNQKCPTQLLLRQPWPAGINQHLNVQQ